MASEQTARAAAPAGPQDPIPADEAAQGRLFAETAASWDEPVRTAAPATAADPVLVVDLGGFEGPLDLLLSLARTQKVDLARISILSLAEQYLTFIEVVRQTRLELAADYLVMAAWLAYLKSRLLLPSPPADDEPTGEELAAVLAFRLRRLEAMREAAARLTDRTRLGRDVFARGSPEAVASEARPRWEASLYDLLSAYAAQRQRQMVTSVRVARRQVWALADAREILQRLIGRAADWTPIQAFLGAYLTPGMRATVLASSFTASLELVREGRLEIRQAAPFAPLYLRARSQDLEEETGTGTTDEPEGPS